jgi:hypothetical protein
MTGPLRSAVIGRGFCPQYQSAGWREVGVAESAVVNNLTPSRAEVLAARFGIPTVSATQRGYWPQSGWTSWMSSPTWTRTSTSSPSPRHGASRLSARSRWRLTSQRPRR